MRNPPNNVNNSNILCLNTDGEKYGIVISLTHGIFAAAIRLFKKKSSGDPIVGIF